MTNCPICTIPAGINGTDELNLTFEITCPRCGKFNATDDFLKFVPGLKPLQIANASGWIREYRQGATLELKDWEPLESLKTPRMGEKADKLLSYLSKTYPKGGANLNSNVNVGRAEIDKPEILAVCWADDQSEVNFLFHDYLAGKNLVDSGMNKTGVRERITPAGWDYLYNRNINPDSQIGFCAMWFDASVNHIWDSAILPAIEQAGYDPKIMRKHQHNNRIDDEIIAMIRRSRFVVADFTHGDKDGARGGVYFEAGFALGLGLQVIHTCRHDFLKEKIHFDNRQFNFVTWEEGKLPEFEKELQDRIEATIGRGKSHSTNRS